MALFKFHQMCVCVYLIEGMSFLFLNILAFLPQVRPFLDGKYLQKAGEAHAANRHYSLLLSRIETMMWEIQWASDLVGIELCVAGDTCLFYKMLSYFIMRLSISLVVVHRVCYISPATLTPPMPRPQYWNARKRFVFAPQLFDAAERFMEANGIADGRYMAIHWRYGGAAGNIL